VVMNFNEAYQPVNVRRQQARRAREKRELEKKAAAAATGLEADVNHSSGVKT
jgi:hypothetical protein